MLCNFVNEAGKKQGFLYSREGDYGSFAYFNVTKCFMALPVSSDSRSKKCYKNKGLKCAAAHEKVRLTFV